MQDVATSPRSGLFAESVRVGVADPVRADPAAAVQDQWGHRTHRLRLLITDSSTTAPVRPCSRQCAHYRSSRCGARASRSNRSAWRARMCRLPGLRQVHRFESCRGTAPPSRTTAVNGRPVLEGVRTLATSLAISDFLGNLACREARVTGVRVTDANVRFSLKTTGRKCQETE